MTDVPNNDEENTEKPEPIGTEDKKPASNCEHQRSHKTKHTWLEKSAVAIAILAFLAAAGQGWVARDTEKRYLRAYVNIVTDGQLNLDGNPVEIQWYMKNYGLTPAYHAHSVGELRILSPKMGAKSGPRPEQLTGIGPHSTSMPLPPNEKIPITLNLNDGRPPTFSDQEKTMINAGDCFVYAFGVIYYDDIFGTPHTTEFRLEYGGANPTRLRAMRFSEKGNDAN